MTSMSTSVPVDTDATPHTQPQQQPTLEPTASPPASDTVSVAASVATSGTNGSPKAALSSANISTLDTLTDNTSTTTATPSASVSVNGKRKRSIGNEDLDGHDSSREQHPEQPSEDDETESEVEIDFEMVDESTESTEPARPPPPSEQVVAAGVMVGEQVRKDTTSHDPDDDDSEQEEEEDEAFPPAQALLAAVSPQNQNQNQNSQPQNLSQNQNQNANANPASIAEQGHDQVGSTRVLEQDQTQNQKQNQNQPLTRDQPGTQAPVPVQATKKLTGIHRPKTRVEVAADETLLRALLVHEAQLADGSQPRRPIWDAVVVACTGRFPNGNAAQARVSWLQHVWRNANHAEYPRLSDALRSMLAQYSGIVRKPAVVRKATGEVDTSTTNTSTIGGGGRVVGASPKRPRKKILTEQTLIRKEKQKLLQKYQQAEADAAARQTQQEEKEKEQNTVVLLTPKAQDKIALNVALEEKLMAIVLKHAPLFATATRKIDVWDQIARDSRGRYESGASAKSHYVWLTRTVLSDPTHREHAKLSPRLKSMCAQVQAFENQRPQTQNKRTAEKQVPASVSVSVSASAASVSAGAKAPTMPQETMATSRHASGGKDDVQPSTDELMMELFMAKRPFDYDRYARPAVWREIADAVPNPRFVNGVYGQKRVSWLADVYANPRDDHHALLTPKLRKLLQEYKELLASSHLNDKPLLGLNKLKKRTKSPVASGMTVDTTGDTTGAVVASTETAAQSLTPERPRRQNTQRVFDEFVVMAESSDDDDGRQSKSRSKSRSRSNLQANGDGESNEEDEEEEEEEERTGEEEEDGEDEEPLAAAPEDSVAPTPFADEVLLREILRVRPFHHKRGEGNQLWDEVRVAVARQIGTNAVFPIGNRCIMRMRKLMLVVRNPTGPSSRMDVPRRQLEMLQLLDTVLKTKWPLTEKRLREEHRVLLAQIDALLARPLSQTPGTRYSPSTTTTTTTPSHLGKRPRQPQFVDHEDEEQEEDDVQAEEEEIAEPEREDEDEELSLEHQQAFQFLYTPATHGTMASPRELVPAPVAGADTSLESCVRQLALQSQRLEQERRAHREELRTLVEMLKDERAAHKRESAAMLAVIQKEREDRRSEFVAMMNLVTRSVLPAAPPPPPPSSP